MSNTNDNKRQQLISKLREIFQMDQADLDWAFQGGQVILCE
ncbi:MAG: hypothetical protein WEK74_15260 [Hydrogenophaga sp.]